MNGSSAAALVALATVAIASTPAGSPAAAARVRTYHVAPSGSDTSRGSARAPFRTIGRALSANRGGERVLVESGPYPGFSDDARRSRAMTVVGVGPVAPTITGPVRILGGQRLHLERLAFRSSVQIAAHVTRRAAQPAVGIAIRDSDISVAGQPCVTIRSGASDVSLERNHIHDCASGIVGPGHAGRSRRIAIRGNVLERFAGDAIAFGGWRDVRIEGNTIRHMQDPASLMHNDGIQLYGDSSRVRISANRISHSAGQLLFVQDALGPIDDVLVENNLVFGSRAYAIQSQGATRARFVNNTIWRSAYGGLLLRAGSRRAGSPVVPTDTVVANNILSGYGAIEGARARVREGNVVSSCPVGEAPGLVCLPDPGFVDAGADDFRLRLDAPARRRASAAYAPPKDLAGERRGGAPSPGALD